MFNRDSILWTLVVVGACFGYLAFLPPPTVWTWEQWMATLAALIAIVTAYLRTPKLAQDGTAPPNLPTPPGGVKIAPLLLLVLFLPLATTGCAPKTVTYETPAAQVMSDANEVLKRIGEVEDATFDLQAKGTLSLKDARIIIQGCRVLDIALPAAASGWKNAAVTAAWEAARTEIPELGDMPTTWQEGANKVWAAIKIRVPAITTNQVYAIAAGAIDGAILKL